MDKEYICYGDYIRSISDGDQHYISAERVAQLYGLNPRKCIFVNIGGRDRLRGTPQTTLDSLKKFYPRAAVARIGKHTKRRCNRRSSAANHTHVPARNALIAIEK